MEKVRIKKVEHGQTGFHEQSWGSQKVNEWVEAIISCIRVLEKKSVSGWNLRATYVWKSEPSALSVKVFKWPGLSQVGLTDMFLRCSNQILDFIGSISYFRCLVLVHDTILEHYLYLTIQFNYWIFKKGCLQIPGILKGIANIVVCRCDSY